ncbi:MAG: hydroxymethylglutaryl-CoA reductase [Desulfobacterales bacterium]|jgi:hydroxymethylglutaryl-CoA reductase (NADPH)|nr:hydroxymethylglutaryl-CoA reductase [Desulfobacterales bacterium]
MSLSSAIEKQVLAAAVDAPAPAPNKTPLHRSIHGAESEGEVEGIRARRRRFQASRFAPPEIADRVSIRRRAVYCRNIENYVGTVKVPVGIVGPLPVNGRFAEGGFMVPLATTEATLIASYNRGAKLLTCAGGCTVRVLDQGVSRAPGFVFAAAPEALEFAGWVESQAQAIRQTAEATTRHGRLTRMTCIPEGNYAFLELLFDTRDASGQNMVTIAAQAVCDYIGRRSPVRPLSVYIESNFSGDKKASLRTLHSVRGRKVSAEAVIPEACVRAGLHTTPAEMERYYRMAAVACSMAGTFGTQGHFANGLAALYLACGQDVACVAESAIGHTRLEVLPGGDLYCSVNLPGVMVATVGGGTALPSQKACLETLGLYGPGKAPALAELAAALCLAGEISIVGAICAGEFTRAHRQMARPS